MITVYGLPPTRGLRVLWMLEEMELPYKVQRVDFATRDQDADFLAVSPVGAFPAIQDGNVTMMESCAILEYLAARYGPTSLVPAPHDPAFPVYLTFLHFGEASLAAPMNVATASRLRAPEGQKQNWGATYAIDNFVRKSAAMVRRLNESPYLAGPNFTAADISCAYAIGLARVIGAEDDLDPVLGDYMDRVTARPAFERASAHWMPLLS